MIIPLHSEEQFLKLDFVKKYSVKSGREMCAELNHDLDFFDDPVSENNHTSHHIYISVRPFFQSTTTEAICKVY